MILVIFCVLVVGVVYLHRQRTVLAPTLVPLPQPKPTETDKTNVTESESPRTVPVPLVSAPVTNEVQSNLNFGNNTNFATSLNSTVSDRTVDNSALVPITMFQPIDSSSHERIALSLRYGLNISGKFKDVGSSFNSGAPLSAGRRTPNGDPYNYDNGYVLTDISGNAGGQSWYWGYDNASQVNSGASTINFNRTTASGFPTEISGDDSSSVGAELNFDYELGVKKDWHYLRYGLEGAFNFTPIEFNSGGLYNATLSQQTDTYSYTPGTTPPSAPYQGSYGGPGFVINVPAVNSTTTLIPGATLLVQDHFDANLWGLRLGPYVDMPVSKRMELFLTGGLAVGLLDSEASWKETLTLPGGGGSLAASGSGSDTALLWGYYVGMDATYQLSDRWGVEGGLQLQGLGTYDHNFGGRVVELDLSKSIFVHAGISFSF